VDHFKLATDAPPLFKVIWKVSNRGEAATRARLRTPSDDPRDRAVAFGPWRGPLALPRYLPVSPT
jgi:hypothetical protein